MSYVYRSQISFVLLTLIYLDIICFFFMHVAHTIFYFVAIWILLTIPHGDYRNISTIGIFNSYSIVLIPFRYPYSSIDPKKYSQILKDLIWREILSPSVWSMDSQYSLLNIKALLWCPPRLIDSFKNPQPALQLACRQVSTKHIFAGMVSYDVIL